MHIIKTDQNVYDDKMSSCVFSIDSIKLNLDIILSVVALIWLRNEITKL